MRKPVTVGSVLLLVGITLLPLSSGLAQSVNPVARLMNGTSEQASSRPFRRFSGRDGTWAWLQKSGYQTTLLAQRPQGSEVQIASGRDWDELAVDGETVWILEKSAGRGALLRVALTPGAVPERVRAGLQDPGALLAQDGRLYWLEATATRVGAPAYIPALAPMLRLWVREANGATNSLGNWSGGSNVLQAAGDHDLIGVANGAVWARIRRLDSTEFVKFPLSGAEAERVAGAAGEQQAILRDGLLYWTAPSTEAAAGGLISIRRLSPRGSELVTDWLPADGLPLAVGKELYYASDQLFRVSATGELPQPLQPLRGSRAVTDGASLVLLNDAVGPTRLDAQPE